MLNEIKELERLSNKYQYNDLRLAVNALKNAEPEKAPSKGITPGVIKAFKVQGMEILRDRFGDESNFEELDRLIQEFKDEN